MSSELSRWVQTTDELPGLARIVAATTVRTVAWTAGSYVRSGRLLARALTDRHAAEQLLHEIAYDVAVATRTVSDVARAAFDIEFTNEVATTVARYDIHTKHAALFGGAGQ